MKKLPWTSAALQQTKGWGRVGGKKRFHHPYRSGVQTSWGAEGIYPVDDPEQSPFSRIHRHYKGGGRSRAIRREGDLAPLSRGAHQPCLPRRATPSSRHPLPPPLPVTLRKEECNCSCPSKQEGA